jgi:DNA-binding CsgD family transcriptional regulator
MLANGLTTREKKLLRRMALGQSDHAIAVDIGGTDAQVAAQRLRLLGKLNIRSQAEIIAAATKLARWMARHAAQQKLHGSPSDAWP